MNKTFYAVEFRSGRNTSTGQPNPKTGRMSIAVWTKVFPSTHERDAWINEGKITSGMRGNCRESVTKRELRNLQMGMSVSDFGDHLSMLAYAE